MATQIAPLSAGRVEAALDAEQKLLAQPIDLYGRLLLVLAAGLLIAALLAPMWRLSFESNQYPDPLEISIYASRLAGAHTEGRDDLAEVNTLNHYIGMRPLAPKDFPEFIWLPFAIGFFALIALRAAAIGSLRDVVDLSALFVYFGGFSVWSFYRRLYQYGHELAPDAPIKVDGFTPPAFGEAKIANFWVSSFPGAGSYLLVAAGVVVAVVLSVTLLQGWRRRRVMITAAADVKGVRST